MIRILHILSSTYLGSGVAAFVMNYYRHIDREKVQFDFLCFKKSDNNFDEEVRELGGNVYYVNKPSIKNIFSTYKEFNEFFRNHACKYIAVHLHTVFLVHFIKYFINKYFIKILITHAHATKYSDNPANSIRNKLMCLGLNNTATVYFACSKAAGEFYYGEKAVKNGKVKVVNNALDLDKYKFDESIRNRVRKEICLEGKFVVGHIGRMAPPKNQMFLLEIFKEVKKEKDNAVLLMIGDGPLRDDVETKVKELNLDDSVILLGSRKDVPELLMAMDVFLLPSLYEGLPIVGIEAQASGLLCFFSENITDEVGITKLANYLSLDRAPSKWAEEIIKSKLNQGSRCLDVDLKEFSVQNEAKKLEQYYLSIGSHL